MSYNETPTNFFQREMELEKSIDRKVALYKFSNSIESLSLFLDILDELIISHNENMDRYSKVELQEYIEPNRLGIEKYTPGTLSNQEHIHMNNFREYMRYIRSKILPPKFTQLNLKRHVFETMKNAASKYRSNPKSIIKEIELELPKSNHLHYTIEENNDNINLYLRKLNYCISIINDPINFQLADHRGLTSLIVNQDASNVWLKIKNSENIDIISYYKPDFEKYITINTKSPLDWCVSETGRILYYLEKKGEQSTVTKKLSDVKGKIRSILSYRPIKNEHLKLDDIKQLRRNFLSIIEIINDDFFRIEFRHAYSIKIDLEKIECMLSTTYNIVKDYSDLNENIYFCLSEIKRNNTLYILSKNNKKTENFSFGEENLASIIASNLRCLYKGKTYISVNCEATVGNGRSDIRLSMHNETFGLIETKLLNQKSSIEKEVTNGIDQLFSRYSENENIKGNHNIYLYLVIFSYDKDFRTLAKSIKKSIFNYSVRNSLDYEKISNTENGVLFSYKESRNEFDFSDKIRNINIMVCNMEIDYKSRSRQRTSKKAYFPSHTT